MIDPAMSAATGAFTGAAVTHSTNSALENVPTWIKFSGLVVILGFIIWWYMLAQEKHRNKVRRVTRRK
jgi:hypothetical protein